jgi:hypothetical protein
VEHANTQTKHQKSAHPGNPALPLNHQTATIVLHPIITPAFLKFRILTETNSPIRELIIVYHNE